MREIHGVEPGLAQHLASLGVTHVVTTSDEAAVRLVQNGELTLLETRGPLRIWQTKATERIDPLALVVGRRRARSRPAMNDDRTSITVSSSTSLHEQPSASRSHTARVGN